MTRWDAYGLIAGLIAPTPVQPSIASIEDAGWETIVSLAGEHLVTSALARPVRDLPSANDEVRRYFDAMHELNQQRNAAILQVLADVIDGFTALGIRPVLLKGAASLAESLYPDDGERFLGDLDLLLEERDLAAASSMLAKNGFLPADNPKRWVRPSGAGRHHLPTLLHAATGVGLELHRKALRPPFAAMLPAAEVLHHAVPVPWRGRQVHVPEPTHRLIHTIAHDQLSHGGLQQNTIVLRQLREAAFLAHRHVAAIDWDAVRAGFERAGESQALKVVAAASMHLMNVDMGSGASHASETLDPLRDGIMGVADSRSPGAGRLTRVKRLAMFYLKNFAHDPRLAVNLLNPAYWPQRVRDMRSFMKQG